MNALVDPQVVRLLDLASQAGVEIHLLVRGICCLRAGVPGVSDNIRVTSIVGRFLEHSRIYYFRNGGGEDEEIYLGSADLMPRNIDRRVEILFPVDNRDIVRHIKDQVFAAYVADNIKARQMMPDGTYVRAATDSEPMNAQEYFVSKTRAAKRTSGLTAVHAPLG
jgi:polyphosphate kinase